MKLLRILGIILLTLSYFILILTFKYENELENQDLNYGIILWVTGIANVVVAVIYGAKIKLKLLIYISLIISGIVWLFIPLIFTYVGLLFLATYLITTIYMYTLVYDKSVIMKK